MRFHPSTLFGIFLLLGLVSCMPEPPKNAEQLLLGHWELTKASRNGNPTNTLESLFFTFFEDGKMVSNFPGQFGEARYEIKENVIQQYEIDNPLSLKIETISDSTLNLTTIIQDFRFRLSLKKVIQEN